MLLRNVAADVGDLLVEVRGRSRSRRSPCGWSAGGRRAARARSGSRCRTRRAAGNRRSRGSRSAPGRSALGSRRRRSSRAPGSSSESRASRAAGSARYAATRAACCGEPPPEIRDAPRIRPSSFTVGRPVHCLAWTRKSPGGMTAVPVKAMCCLIIEAWWSRQRRRWSTSSSSLSASGSIAWISWWAFTEAGLRTSCHSFAWSRHSLPSNTSAARWTRSGNDSGGTGCHLPVAEPVDVGGHAWSGTGRRRTPSCRRTRG